MRNIHKQPQNTTYEEQQEEQPDDIGPEFPFEEVRDETSSQVRAPPGLSTASMAGSATLIVSTLECHCSEAVNESLSVMLTCLLLAIGASARFQAVVALLTDRLPIKLQFPLEISNFY